MGQHKDQGDESPSGHDADVQAGNGQQVSDAAAMKGFPQMGGYPASVTQDQGLQNVPVRSLPDPVDEVLDPVSGRIDTAKRTGDVRSIQQAHLFSRAVSGCPYLLKRHVAPVIECSRVAEIADAADSTGQLDAISAVQIDFGADGRHSQQAGRSAVSLSVAESLDLQNEPGAIGQSPGTAVHDPDDVPFGTVYKMNDVMVRKAGIAPR